HYPGRLPFSDLHGHGTFVTSIVASNANVVAGINRYVTLLAVKINDSTRASSASRFLSGIVYAADQGADVINISDGRQFNKKNSPGTIAAFERAVNYAFRKGALLVTVPFNDVAGLAALLVAQLGHGNPGLIRARILESADDLGEPGTDPYYGKGRINIARALGVLP